MPWSDWQDPVHVDGVTELVGEITSVNASRQVAGVNDANALLSQTIADALATTPAPGSVVQDVGADQSRGDTADPNDGTGAHASISQLVYRLNATRFLTYRDWFPSTLRSLTQGVDYDVIPGKDPNSDDDAYVEYEAGDNTLQGWRAWTVPVEYTVNVIVGPSAAAPNPASIPFRVGVAAGDVASWPTYGAGSQVARLDTFPSPDYGTQDVSIPGGGTDLAFALLFQPDTLNGWHPSVSVAVPPPLSPDKSTSAIQQTLNPVAVRDGGSSTPVITGPVMPFDTPRWRYWIPETTRLPLRQRQRDDGLGLSTARWTRGRSRQASNRWRGYR